MTVRLRGASKQRRWVEIHILGAVRGGRAVREVREGGHVDIDVTF